MRIADSILAEIDQEGASTARMLERVPADRLQWRPHEKSMTVGELAWHLATIPLRVSTMLGAGEFDLLGARPGAMPDDPGGILDAFRLNLAAVRAAVDRLDDAAMRERFRLRRGDVVVREIPKVAVIRSILLNHSYHHRGQMAVYLRLLDIPVPAMYGSSADERP